MVDGVPPAGNDRPAPLAGIGVVVTRPAAQAAPVATLLESLGARVLRVPLLAIEAPSDPDRAVGVLRRAASFQLAIFVSVNAVERGLALLDSLNGVPAGLRLAAIGRATAEALTGAGLVVDRVPAGRFDSEALLALAALQPGAVAGQRILIVRGEGGRETLAETLRGRGAEVEYAEVYRRVKPTVDVAALDAAGRAGAIHAVLLTSGEALEHLLETLGSTSRPWLDRALLVVPSARVAELARRAGRLGTVRVAPEASDRGMVEALRTWCAEGRRAPEEPTGVRATAD